MLSRLIQLLLWLVSALLLVGGAQATTRLPAGCQSGEIFGYDKTLAAELQLRRSRAEDHTSRFVTRIFPRTGTRVRRDRVRSRGLRFTGKERDAETGLDFFEARYMSSAQGRFTSPDPLPGWQGDPQSWNMYAYARNNPLLYTDPTGMSYEVCDTQGNCTKKDLSDAEFNKFKKDSTSDYFANGKIYHRNDDGSVTQTGTYRRTGDDLDDGAVSILTGLEQRAGASNQFIGAFAGASIVAGTGVGLALQASGGAGLTTLSNITPNNLVYQSINALGDVQYVGITNSFARRQAQHAARFVIQRVPGLQNLTRAEAPAVEQVLIEKFGLAKNGGTLLNQINSIASTNPIYANSLKVGAQILKNVGYPGF